MKIKNIINLLIPICLMFILNSCSSVSYFYIFNKMNRTIVIELVYKAILNNQEKASEDKINKVIETISPPQYIDINNSIKEFMDFEHGINETNTGIQVFLHPGCKLKIAAVSNYSHGKLSGQYSSSFPIKTIKVNTRYGSISYSDLEIDRQFKKKGLFFKTGINSYYLELNP